MTVIATTLVISIGVGEAPTPVILTGVSEANAVERSTIEISPFRLRLQSK